VMNKITTHPVAAKRVIAPGVDGSDVTGLERNVMNLVELNQVIVSPEQDRAMRVILDEIVRSAQSNPGHANRRDVAFGPAALALEMAIFDKVPTRFQCLAIATGQLHSAVTSIKNVATNHPVADAAIDHHCVVARATDPAAR